MTSDLWIVFPHTQQRSSVHVFSEGMPSTTLKAYLVQSSSKELLEEPHMAGSPETAGGPRVITPTASGSLQRVNDAEQQPREPVFAVAPSWPGSVSEYICPPSWAMLCCAL